MSEELDLSLPKVRTEARAKKGPGYLVLLLAILAVSAGNLAVVWSRGAVNEPARASLQGGLSTESRKQLALKLEKQGLHEQAALAWREYLSASNLDSEQVALIWYRLATLYQDAGEYARALDGYYRSENHSAVEELSPEIGRRVQECLEKLGKFAALRYELSERVGLSEAGKEVGDEVVAEIGPQKITKSELDTRIEAEIERRLSQLATYMPAEELNKQKESMLGNSSTSSERMRFLNQFVLGEILYRKARESKLTDDPDVRALLRSAERDLLAQKVIEKELKSEIKITESDLRTYYEARRKDYVRPERAAISHILVSDEDAAKKVLERLKAGEEFDKLTKELSQDDATRDKGGEIDGWARKEGYIPGIGDSDEARTLVFAADSGTVAESYVKSEKGYHIIKVREKQPEMQKTFEEVNEEVFRTLRAQKEREVQENLLARLRDQYDVVIHHSAFAEKEPVTEEEKK